MKDRYGRTISYLRISVTDRCNLRCRYCAPIRGFRMLRHEDILSYEEILTVVRAGVAAGITKVRITGGEPLVRKGVVGLVEMINAVPGIQDLSMTTNGHRLAEYAADLAAAGLQRVNVSLDTIDPHKYAAGTGGGDVKAPLAGIEAARAAGLWPIKLNCVVEKSSAEPHAREMAAFAREAGLQVRFIPRMDMTTGHFGVVEGGSGGDCPNCNRMRLSSDGKLRPCLFSDLSFDVRKLGAVEALARAVREKPERGGLCTHDWMHGIGG